MPRNVRCHDVLIASPSDVLEERRIIVDCIEDWNAVHSRGTGLILEPRRWEFDAMPDMGDRAQGVINRQIVDSSDILIGVFWRRLGTPTGVDVSGTAEELKRFIDAGKPVMLYFSKRDLPFDHDRQQFEALLAFRNQLPPGLVFEFSEREVFRRLVSKHFGLRMHELAAAPVVTPATTKGDLATLRIRTDQRVMNGEVPTVQVIVEIQNLSKTVRLKEYFCTVSVPASTLTFAMTTYMDDRINDRESGRVRFQVTERDRPPIYPGEIRQVIATYLGIEQLKMKGTWLEGDYEGTLADKVIAEAFVEGEQLHTEKLISEIFATN